MDWDKLKTIDLVIHKYMNDMNLVIINNYTNNSYDDNGDDDNDDTNTF